jgi:hypothetical protein
MRSVVWILLSIVCAFVLGVSSAAPASDAPPKVTVIADSVLTGVLWYPESLAILQQDLDVRMEVAVCRRLTGTSCTFEDTTPPTLVSLVQEKGASLGPTVLVAMGYNDSQRTFAASAEASIRALLRAHVQRILWATLRAARHPYVEMNDVLFAAARRHPEVTLVDWNKYSRSHPEWFQNDGLHLERVGGIALATFLHAAIFKALRSPLPLVLKTTQLPEAHVGRPYSARLAARGGRPPYRWRIVGGSLPRGLRLAPGGSISGMPARRARAVVSLRVADADGRVVTRRHVLVVR